MSYRKNVGQCLCCCVSACDWDAARFGQLSHRKHSSARRHHFLSFKNCSALLPVSLPERAFCFLGSFFFFLVFYLRLLLMCAVDWSWSWVDELMLKEFRKVSKNFVRCYHQKKCMFPHTVLFRNVKLWVLPSDCSHFRWEVKSAAALPVCAPSDIISKGYQEIIWWCFGL